MHTVKIGEISDTIEETQKERKATLDVPGAITDGRLSREELQAEYDAVNKFLNELSNLPTYDQKMMELSCKDPDELALAITTLNKLQTIATGNFLTQPEAT